MTFGGTQNRASGDEAYDYFDDEDEEDDGE